MQNLKKNLLYIFFIHDSIDHDKLIGIINKLFYYCLDVPQEN